MRSSLGELQWGVPGEVNEGSVTQSQEINTNLTFSDVLSFLHPGAKAVFEKHKQKEYGDILTFQPRNFSYPKTAQHFTLIVLSMQV